MTIRYREFRKDELEAARSLSQRNPDIFGRYATGRLPCYFKIEDLVYSLDRFKANQVLMLGAFVNDQPIGLVFVTHQLTWEIDLEEEETVWDRVFEHYSFREAEVYWTLARDLRRTCDVPPAGSLLVHSLCVDPSQRGKGVAARLLEETVRRTPPADLQRLFIAAALNHRHPKMCEAAGFRLYRRRFSLFDRIQFGCWGSVLMKYHDSDSGVVPTAHKKSRSP